MFLRRECEVLLQQSRTSSTTPSFSPEPGLTSNFFVVEQDGTIFTAPSGVLLGGMRQLVISACEEEGIALRLEAPDTARASLWREAFLTGELGRGKLPSEFELKAGWSGPDA